jgi:hypothetical protein
MNSKNSFSEKNQTNQDFNNLVDKYIDHYNCNQIETALYNCYVELDKKIFFKKRKYKKCLNIQKDFQHCLIYSNEYKIQKREPYYAKSGNDDNYEKYTKAKIENKKDAFDYVSGKKTEKDILNKENPNVRKNLIEL